MLPDYWAMKTISNSYNFDSNYTTTNQKNAHSKELNNTDFSRTTLDLFIEPCQTSMMLFLAKTMDD